MQGLSELFAAAETVARFRPMSRARVAIVTNGGGAGVLAVDRLIDGAGELATLGPETLERLDAALPPGWSRQNPVDIDGDAPPERYLAALDALAADHEVDALLVMHSPTALAASADIAGAIAARVERGQLAHKPVLSCWLGGATAREARAVLRARGAPSYGTPATAAAAVGHLTEWGRAQAALLHVPDRSVDDHSASATARARVAELFAVAAREGRRFLSEPEAKAVLAAYGMPVPPVAVARTPAEVGRAAAGLLADGGRLVVKMLSADIRHKSDLGGVVLGLETAAAAAAAAEGIAERVRAGAAGKTLDGFSVQPMIERPDALELILGVTRDPVFGPVLLFGAGGVAVELLRDTAVALPPLDAGLAAALVARTRIGAQLAGYRNRPPADAAALHGALVALSHLVEDFPCLRAVDVNPLIADAAGVLALDARIEIDPDDHRTAPNPDMAIRPYPGAWRRTLDRPEGRYELRPIRPVDALLYPEFWKHTTPEDVRRRFLAPRKFFSREAEMRWTQLDYDREMAFVALTSAEELAGVSRISCDPDHRRAEYSLLVRSDMQGKGLGTALMRLLIDYAVADGLERLEGYVLADNHGMLALINRLGFETAIDADDPGVLTTWLELGRPGQGT